jgi:hypothetical protein
MPCDHLLACAGPHQTHAGADRHTHGQPEPWRRDSLTSAQRCSLSAMRMQPAERSAAMISLRLSAFW